MSQQSTVVPIIQGPIIQGPIIQGWCPGALKPMLSGDGYVVRIRPHSGRVAAEQMAAIAALSETHGNGLIDFSARANIQMRGVTADSHAPLIEALGALGLIDGSIAEETTRNILVTPFWQAGDGTVEIADALAARLASGPALPGKFGFAVDTGPQPVLSEASSDIRLERAADGTLVLRADGMERGTPVTPEEAADKAVALAEWFLSSGGAPQGRGRMARHLASGAELPAEFAPTLAPAPAAPDAIPGLTGAGFLAGFEFGQATAATIAALSRCAPAFRITPWRMVLAEGLAEVPAVDGLIADPAEPLLNVHACTGAPGCPQALAPTRDLARALAPQLPKGARLHVSACTKGCSHPSPCAYTLVATDDGFALVRDGTASDVPVATGLDPVTLLADPAGLFGLQ
ncbi:MAG: precorrin-3B synthase [Hyphomicrobiales bacterium]|nr:MAG: precorrin-3B synthase [Hyphomicrobiales bacterium]